jgi:hypothetical protein
VLEQFGRAVARHFTWSELGKEQALYVKDFGARP